MEKTKEKEQRTIADVERELKQKKDQIEQRLEALQEEVSTVGPSIRDAVFKHPLVSVGGALLAGLLVGLMAGGKKRPKDAYGAKANHRALVDHYVGAIVEEARHRMAEGQDADEAVRAALQERVPLIVYEVPEAADRPGIVGQLMSLALRQLLPLGIQMGMEYLNAHTEEDVGEDASDGV